MAPDHLIRHKTFENYIEAKNRIFENQGKNDYCILNFDDEITQKLNKKTKAKVFYFSMKDQSKNKKFFGNFYIDNKFYYKDKKGIKFIIRDE